MNSSEIKSVAFEEKEKKLLLFTKEKKEIKKRNLASSRYSTWQRIQNVSYTGVIL